MNENDKNKMKKESLPKTSSGKVAKMTKVKAQEYQNAIARQKTIVIIF